MGDPLDYFAEALCQAGITHAFGVVGSGQSYRLVDNLVGRGVLYCPCAHEAAAALMAGAMCRDGRTRAMSISIRGPGFINAAAGVLSNFYESRPAISVSEALRPYEIDARAHKRLSHGAISREIAKYFGTLDERASFLPSLIDSAQSEIPGPVHIDMTDPISSGGASQHLPHVSENCDSGDWERLRKAITSSRRPALVLGSLALRRLAAIDFTQAQVPVFTTAAGKGAIDESSPYAAGIITGERAPLAPENNLLELPDLVIAIGLRAKEVIVPRPFTQDLIMVDQADSSQSEGFAASLSVKKHRLTDAVPELLSLLQGKAWGAEEIGNFRERLNREIFTADWSLPHMFSSLNVHRDTITTFVLDTGLFCTVGETVLRVQSSNNFCGSSCARFMGTALPTAIGIARQSPEHHVVCVIGDGGIAPFLGELRTARHLPILTILVSDGRYGSIAAAVARSERSRHAYTIEDSTWCDVVEKIGVPSLRISGRADFEQALANWCDEPVPLFLEIPFEPEHYASTARKLR